MRREFLREYLADGPMPSEDVAKAATGVGISRRTLERARRDVGVVATRRTDPQTGRMRGWQIALPDHDATPPTTSPPLADWRSGRSGPDQGKHTPVSPDRQLTESGVLDTPAFFMDERF